MQELTQQVEQNLQLGLAEIARLESQQARLDCKQAADSAQITADLELGLAELARVESQQASDHAQLSVDIQLLNTDLQGSHGVFQRRKELHHSRRRRGHCRGSCKAGWAGP